MSAAKAPKSDVKVLKGKDAEDKVLEYVKRMNRPYGAVDISANLKGAVPKTATQKILLSLADKGDLVMKTYGKTTFFLANQANLECMSADKLAALEQEHKSIDDENKARAAEVKNLTNELARLKSMPTDDEIITQFKETDTAIQLAAFRLESLRVGTPLISSEELAILDSTWDKWKNEWARRKKNFNTFWQIVTDALPPQDTATLAEDLGIEFDTPEHIALQESSLCARSAMLAQPTKRKRDAE